MLTTKDFHNFRSIVEVTSMLDCSVLQDSEYGGDTGRERHFWLGDAGDTSVGLPTFTASPAFKTLRELDQFCADNMQAYLQTADNIDRDGEIPDTWFWQPDTAPSTRQKMKP
jgi:hypothetical protein